MTVNPNLVQHTLGVSDLVDVTEPKRPWWLGETKVDWEMPREFPTRQDEALREPEETPDA